LIDFLETMKDAFANSTIFGLLGYRVIGLSGYRDANRQGIFSFLTHTCPEPLVLEYPWSKTEGMMIEMPSPFSSQRCPEAQEQSPPHGCCMIVAYLQHFFVKACICGLEAGLG